MISVNNYVYTNNGIYSVGELYDLVRDYVQED